MSAEMDKVKASLRTFKCINVGIGLFSVALTGAGHSKQSLSKAYPVFCSYDAYSSIQPYVHHDHWSQNAPCIHIWAAHVGMSLVIIAWLFSIAMVIGSYLFRNAGRFQKLDLWGHRICGMALILSLVFMLVYVITSVKTICSDGYDSHCSDIFIYDSKYILWIFGMVFAAGFAASCIWTTFVLMKTQKVDTDNSEPMNELPQSQS